MPHRKSMLQVAPVDPLSLSQWTFASLSSCVATIYLWGIVHLDTVTKLVCAYSHARMKLVSLSLREGSVRDEIEPNSRARRRRRHRRSWSR